MSVGSMMTDGDAPVASLKQALALAQEIGSAESYADLVTMAVHAFDDGVIHSLVLLVYRYDAQGAPSFVEFAAGWRRGLERHPSVGQRLDLAVLPFTRLRMTSMRVVPDLDATDVIDDTILGLVRRAGARAYIALPLALHGAMIGTIFLSWPVPRAFDATTLRVAETLMALAPGVAQRIRLYEDSCHQLAELTILRDELERRVAERTVELHMFQAIVDGAHDPVAIATLEGVITYANAAFAALIGVTDNLAGHEISDYFVTEDAAKLTEEVLPALLNTRGWRGTLRLLQPDGSVRISDLNAFCLYDDAGEVTALTGIFRDVTEERQAETEMAALREQVIAAQQATLRELSTPLIPIADGVVAMPLIGRIDSSRSQQVIETLLNGVVALHAHTTIIDITGVPLVDTEVANALLRAAQAVKLLGATVVLTGIRPEVAQTLVGLGIDLSGIITRSTLQSGIADAITRLGSTRPRDRK